MAASKGVLEIILRLGEWDMSGQPAIGSVNNFIGVDCTALDVFDPSGGPSNLIINKADAFQVSTDWRLAGTFAQFLAAQRLPYVVTYYYEGLGNIPEGELGRVSRQTDPGKLQYGPAETTLNVPAGTLSVDGTYKLTVVVSFPTNPPTVPAPMTAFFDGPVMEIF